MGGLPDALFVIDVQHERIAVDEANKLQIPVFGVVDTNSDPDGIDWVIPGNDDAIRAIRLYVTAVAEEILKGKTIGEGNVDVEEFVADSAADSVDESEPEPEPEVVEVTEPELVETESPQEETENNNENEDENNDENEDEKEGE